MFDRLMPQRPFIELLDDWASDAIVKAVRTLSCIGFAWLCYHMNLLLGLTPDQATFGTGLSVAYVWFTSGE